MVLEVSDREAVLTRLAKAGAIEEIAQVTLYKGYVKGPTGGLVEVAIEIHDHGADQGPFRFTVIARDEIGNVATGNGGSTLEGTIATVHWANLGRSAK